MLLPKVMPWQVDMGQASQDVNHSHLVYYFCVCVPTFQVTGPEYRPPTKFAPLCLSTCLCAQNKDSGDVRVI